MTSDFSPHAEQPTNPVTQRETIIPPEARGSGKTIDEAADDLIDDEEEDADVHEEGDDEEEEDDDD